MTITASAIDPFSKSVAICRVKVVLNPNPRNSICRVLRSHFVAAFLSISLLAPVVRAQQPLPNGAYSFAHLSLLPASPISHASNSDLAQNSAALSPVNRRLGTLADLPAQAHDSSQPPDLGASTATADSDAEISWKALPANVLKDQKDIWLFPTQLARGKHWLPVVGVVGVTGIFIATDPNTMPYFRRTPEFDEFTEVFSGTNTGILEIAVPASFYLVGWTRHDSYAQHTALLMAEAYVDSAIPHVVAKVVSRRLRPSAVAPTGDFSDTFFRSSVTPFGKGSSFPSGHAAAAFSIATVLSERYRRHRWVPWVAYATAGLITFSRVPDSAHFASDSFFGAALGYTIAHFEVMRRHRSSD